MKNMICCVMAVATAFATARAESTRPRSEADCERVMRENAYAGEWEERQYGQVNLVAFGADGKGALMLDDRGFPFTWRSNGDGKIVIDSWVFGEKFKWPVFEYDPKTDRISLGFEGKLSRRGFTGYVTFKSKELCDVSKWYMNIAKLEMPKPVNRKKRKEQKLAAGQTLRTVTNLADEIEPDTLFKRQVSIETVDDMYPRIITPKNLLMSNLYCVQIRYGRYDVCPEEEHFEAIDPGRCKRNQRESDPPCQVGLRKDDVVQAMKEMNEIGMNCTLRSYDFGTGKSAWREDELHVFGERETYQDMMKILRRYIFTDTKMERLVVEGHVRKCVD